MSLGDMAASSPRCTRMLVSRRHAPAPPARRPDSRPSMRERAACGSRRAPRPSEAHGRRDAVGARIGVQAADRGAAREDAVAQAERRVEHLVEVAERIIASLVRLLPNSETDQRSSAPCDREARAEQGVAVLQRLRVGVGDEADKLVGDEGEVAVERPAEAARADVAGPVDREPAAEFGREGDRLARSGPGCRRGRAGPARCDSR